MVDLGSDASREIADVKLTRFFACYLQAIAKALASIQNAQLDVKYHLREVTKMLTYRVIHEKSAEQCKKEDKSLG